MKFPMTMVLTMIFTTYGIHYGVTYDIHYLWYSLSFVPEWAPEVLELCKEFRDQGVVGIDLAGLEFEPGTPAEECALKKVFQVT